MQGWAVWFDLRTMDEIWRYARMVQRLFSCDCARAHVKERANQAHFSRYIAISLRERLNYMIGVISYIFCLQFPSQCMASTSNKVHLRTKQQHAELVPKACRLISIGVLLCMCVWLAFPSSFIWVVVSDHASRWTTCFGMRSLHVNPNDLEVLMVAKGFKDSTTYVKNPYICSA